MTDTTSKLPDLLVRTTSRGDRFAWRLTTLEGEMYMTSSDHAAKVGGPSDFETRADARQAAGKVLIDMVEAQGETMGEIVPMSLSTPMGPARLAA